MNIVSSRPDRFQRTQARPQVLLIINQSPRQTCSWDLSGLVSCFCLVRSSTNIGGEPPGLGTNSADLIPCLSHDWRQSTIRTSWLLDGSSTRPLQQLSVLFQGQPIARLIPARLDAFVVVTRAQFIVRKASYKGPAFSILGRNRQNHLWWKLGMLQPASDDTLKSINRVPDWWTGLLDIQDWLSFIGLQVMFGGNVSIQVNHQDVECWPCCTRDKRRQAGTLALPGFIAPTAHAFPAGPPLAKGLGRLQRQVAMLAG